MNNRKIRLGVVPMRRVVFDLNKAIEQKELIYRALAAYDVEVVDIEGIVENGIVCGEEQAGAVVSKLRAAQIDALFFPHCDFGTEGALAKIAAAFDLPILLWGNSQNEIENEAIVRYTQCGLFAAGKALRRAGKPFDYIVTCSPNDAAFTLGMENFLGVASLLRAFRRMKILQICTRPAAFWSVKCNEGELYERFGIEILPMALDDLANDIYALIEKDTARIDCEIDRLESSVQCGCIGKSDLRKVVAMKLVIEDYFARYDLSGAAIQCWSAMQNILGIKPCATFGLLCDEFLPVACETDIKGAITSVLLQEALRRKTPVFFSDITIRHPENPNANLLWHCGNFPPSLAKEGACRKLAINAIEEAKQAAIGEWELKGGPVTVCRFDEDFGEYSLLVGEGRTVEGPKVNGTYVWLQVPDWPMWEERLVTGPYIHHVSCAHASAAPVLYAACKYIKGLKIDLLNPTEEEIKKTLRGC